MITPEEGLLTMDEAVAYVRAEWCRPCERSTIRKWAKVGLRGIRLEIAKAGDKAVTSKLALCRFFNALGRADMPPPPGPDPRPRGMSPDAAEAALR